MHSSNSITMFIMFNKIFCFNNIPDRQTNRQSLRHSLSGPIHLLSTETRTNQPFCLALMPVETFSCLLESSLIFVNSANAWAARDRDRDLPGQQRTGSDAQPMYTTETLGPRSIKYCFVIEQLGLDVQASLTCGYGISCDLLWV